MANKLKCWKNIGKDSWKRQGKIKEEIRIEKFKFAGKESGKYNAILKYNKGLLLLSGNNPKKRVINKAEEYMKKHNKC